MPTPDPLSHFASELHIAQVPPAVRTQLGWILLDTVGARTVLDVLRYAPGRKARRIECPLLVAICDHDSVAPAHKAARQTGRAAQAFV